MNKMVSKIVQQYSPLFKDYNALGIFATPEIPAKKLQNALSSYATNVDQQDVLVLIDDTVLESAKLGAILTSTAFYIHSLCDKPNSIRISDIHTVSLTQRWGTSKILLNGNKFLEVSAPSKEAMRHFTNMLTAIVNEVHADNKAAFSQPDNASDNQESDNQYALPLTFTEKLPFPCDNNSIQPNETSVDCEKTAFFRNYIINHVIGSDFCTTRKYTNKNIDFEKIYRELSDYFEGHFRWQQAFKLKFDDIFAIVADGAMVIFKGSSDACLLKVHVPYDTIEAKADIKGALKQGLKNTVMARILYGHGANLWNLRQQTASALENAMLDKKLAQQAIIEESRQLQDSIAVYIDDLVKTNASIVSQTVTGSGDDVMTLLKKLAALKDSGIITDADFQQKKKELLSRL